MNKQMALLSLLFRIRFFSSPRKGAVCSSRMVVCPDSREAIRHLHRIFLLETFQSPYSSEGTVYRIQCQTLEQSHRYLLSFVGWWADWSLV